MTLPQKLSEADFSAAKRRRSPESSNSAARDRKVGNSAWGRCGRGGYDPPAKIERSGFQRRKAAQVTKKADTFVSAFLVTRTGLEPMLPP